jgi:hypothetical protein
MPKLRSKQAHTHRRARRCAPLLITLAYNANNKLKGWLWSDGKARSISYDSFGLVSGYSLGDAAGSSITEANQPAINIRPIISCSLFTAFKGRTMTLKRVI